MKLHSILLLILSVSFISGNVKGQDLIFEKTYGGAKEEVALSVCHVSSGGYALLGTSLSFVSNKEVYLVRTDENGDTLWTNIYGGSDDQDGTSISETFDKGFILGGSAYKHSSAEWDFWLVKTDSAGNQLWKKTFGGAGQDYIREVRQTPDSGFIIVGFTTSFSTTKHIYLIKTDKNGTTSWTKVIGNGTTEGYSIGLTNDGGYIICGVTDYQTNGQNDFYLAKTDASGTVLWSKTYGGPSNEIGMSVKPTHDNGYIMTGTTRSYGAGEVDIWLVKTNQDGDTLWTKTFGGANYDYGRAVCLTPAGYAVCATTSSFGNGTSRMYIILTDTHGIERNSFMFGSDTTAREGWGMFSYKNELLAVGGAKKPGSAFNDYYFVKLEDFSSVNEIENSNIFQIYPNPSNDIIFIKCNSVSPAELGLFDISGKKIMSKKVTYNSDCSLNVSSLSPGTYIIEMKINGKAQRTKFVKK